MKEEQKGEFAKKAEAFATDCSTAFDGREIGLIVIAVDDTADEKHVVIGMTGMRGLMVDGLASFINRPEALPFLEQALKEAAINAIADRLTKEGVKDVEPAN